MDIRPHSRYCVDKCPLSKPLSGHLSLHTSSSGSSGTNVIKTRCGWAGVSPMCPAGVVVVVTSLLGTASVIKPLLLPAFCPTFTRPSPLVPGGSGRNGREGEGGMAL